MRRSFIPPGSNRDPYDDLLRETVDSYPDGFRYPVGYLPQNTRVTDRVVLESWDELLRPFVIEWKPGDVRVDPEAPVAVRRLSQKSDGSVLQALRYVQWNGPPDESLQASFDCEDQISYAETLSEAGHHEYAVVLVRRLPPPFQRTAESLKVLVESLKALERYEEALGEVRFLKVADTITEYARDLYRIDETILLMMVGRLDEAETLLNLGRKELRGFYTYCGARAALALQQGRRELAQLLVLRAGKVEPYHSYKLLWNPLLAPLRDCIVRELLDEDGQPLLHRQNSEIRRLCHQVQGALLTDQIERARNLAEGFALQRVLDWPCAYELILCLVGLGEFVTLERIIDMLPGVGGDTRTLVRLIARCQIARQNGDDGEFNRSLDSLDGIEGSQRLMEFGLLSSPQDTDEAGGDEWLLAIVSDRWNEEGRERFYVYEKDLKFTAHGVFETRERRLQSVGDPRLSGAATRLIEFKDLEDLQDWLEEKLQDNEEIQKDMFVRHRWETCVNGYHALRVLNPDRERTPILAGLWTMMSEDPLLYFTNGPGAAHGLEQPLPERLIYMLRIQS